MQRSAQHRLEVQNAALRAVIESLQAELMQLHDQEKLRRVGAAAPDATTACEQSPTECQLPSPSSDAVSPPLLQSEGIDFALSESTELGECGICLNRICMAAVGSCSHHFCLACLLRACSKRQECPKCRTPIRALRTDPEFDVLLRAAGAPPSEAEVEHQHNALASFSYLLQLPPDSRPGLTVRRWKHGPGLVVIDVVGKDQAYRCGLRADDRIVAMNGAAVTSAEGFISTLDARARSPKTEALTLLVLKNE